MYKFNNFPSEITESLNVPVEFEITTDTKLPTQIYATFKIGDTDYRVFFGDNNL